MSVPGGLPESAAAMLVRLMVVEHAGVDIAYVGRFAALAAGGAPRPARAIQARLITDARCLEAFLAAGLSEVTDVVPVELGAGLRPMTPSKVQSRWRDWIEGWLAGGHVRAAELNAFLAAFAEPADDGHELLRAINDLDECRRTLWHDTRRPAVLPTLDRERLRDLDAKRQRLRVQIRSRYPAAAETGVGQAAAQVQTSGLNADLNAANEEWFKAHQSALNTKAAVINARIAGVQTDYRNAVWLYERSKRRLEAAQERVIELRARAEERRERFVGGAGIPHGG